MPIIFIMNCFNFVLIHKALFTMASTMGSLPIKKHVDICILNCCFQNFPTSFKTVMAHVKSDRGNLVKDVFHMRCQK